MKFKEFILDLNKPEIFLDEYICNEYLSKYIYETIKRIYDENKNGIIINLNNTKTMTTICSENIFGKLYVVLGNKKFFGNIKIKCSDVHLNRTIINGIERAISKK